MFNYKGTNFPKLKELLYCLRLLIDYLFGYFPGILKGYMNYYFVIHWNFEEYIIQKQEQFNNMITNITCLIIISIY